MNEIFNNNLNNSYEEENNEEKGIKDIKKTIKTYKFHMFHHNGLLEKLKKNGINPNSIDEIFKKNASLLIEFLKNNNENTLKKSFSEINILNNKNIGNKNYQTLNQNSINILKSYYESYGKNNNKEFQLNNINQINKESQKKDSKMYDYSKDKKRNSIYSLNSKKIKIKKKFSIDSNKQYNNSLNNSFRKEESKNIQKGKKGRASVQLSSNKVYLSINEDNFINNEEQNQKVNESNSNNEKIVKLKDNNKSNNNIFKKIPINKSRQKSSKRYSNFTHISNNSNSNYYIQNNFKNSLPNIKRYNKIFYLHNNKRSFYKHKSYNSFQPYSIKGSVNFKKMLSRAYLDKINRIEENIYSTITPNYEAIRPKCIMKVTYKNKKYNLHRPPFKGMSADYTFDMNKIFFKYNNHIPPKSFEFYKMAGRGNSTNSKLPSFMIGKFDRQSCITFNEKNLKLNSYANGQLKSSISSFNDRKSFNFKLNEEKSKNNFGNDQFIEFENKVKKIIEEGIINNNECESNLDNEKVSNNSNNTENKNINSIPFRIKTMFKNFMSEYKRKNSLGNKIDGITFKSFKNTYKKQKYCKEYNDYD